MTKPVTHPASPWAANPQLDTRLRELWAQGLSHSKIAAELGHNLTRSAIAGRIMRLGITRAWILNYANMVDSAKGAKEVQNVKNEAANESRKIASKRSQAGNGARQTLKFGVPTSAVQKPPRPMRPEPPYDGEPVSVENVRSCHCRWPIMVADEFVGFCGAEKTRGAYCATHGRRAYMANVKEVAA